MSMGRVTRSLGRAVATLLWFRIPGGWIYYAILGAYALFVGAAVWLLTRPGWLSVLGGGIVLLEGLAVTLILLHRWLNHRLGQTPRAPH